MKLGLDHVHDKLENESKLGHCGTKIFFLFFFMSNVHEGQNEMFISKKNHLIFLYQEALQISLLLLKLEMMFIQ